MAPSPERRAERAREWGQARLPLRKRGEIVVADGYALQVSVQSSQLRIIDGAGGNRRERRYGRATSNIARLVVLGRAGTISLAALGWLADLGIGLICLDRDGRALAVSGQFGLDDARLRRAQALAATSPVGVEIGRFLLAEKVGGQRELVAQLPDLGAALAGEAAITSALAELEHGETIEQLRMAESQAARAYWQAWSRAPVMFARRDAQRVPESWRVFGTRTSPLTGGPRLATSPGNAILNLLYALAEREASLALRVVGLDSGVGIVHRDQPARDSLALDLLEAIRPDIDGYLLDLLRERTFAASDFYMTRRGSVRVLPPLSHQLAETLPAWAELLAPLAEQLAETLVTGRPTPLTQTRRSAGRDSLRRRAPRPLTPSTPKVARSSCQACGTALPDSSRMFCHDCRPEQHRAQGAAFSAAAQAELARLRAAGRDPRATPEARRKLGEAIARREREAAEWNRDHPRPDLEQFRAEILPLIQSVPLDRLALATGLSVGHLSFVRRGLRTPHPRHWPALRAAAALQDDREAVS